MKEFKNIHPMVTASVICKINSVNNLLEMRVDNGRIRELYGFTYEQATAIRDWFTAALGDQQGNK
jgi:hypothetical protein